jgi:hypothetical protein
MTAQPLLTPATIVFGGIGFCWLMIRRAWLAFIVAIGFALVARWGISGVPKAILPAVPGLILCVFVGFSLALDRAFALRTGQVARTAVLFLMAAILVVPWVLGIRASLGDSAWGPEFELTSFDRPKPENSRLQVGFTLGSPTAVPTSEGPRPLWGHGAVLLGGEWRRLAIERAQCHARVIDLAIGENLPIVAIDSLAIARIELVVRGFVSSQQTPGEVEPFGRWAAREFRDQQGSSRTVYQRFQAVESKNSWFSDLVEELDPERLVLLGYPGTLRDLHQEGVWNMLPLGPEGALVTIAGPNDAPADQLTASPSLEAIANEGRMATRLKIR